MPGGQQSFSQQTVQKSYSAQSPVTEGAHSQSHGVQQSHQYAQHSVQYGTQGGTQQGYSVQHGGAQLGSPHGMSVSPQPQILGVFFIFVGFTCLVY
jgi:cobalamin biosynthesis Mg chelatase CobN